MELSSQQSIIKTLSYFDIFDYPLTLPEIKKYCGKVIESSDDELLEMLLSIPIVSQSSGYFYFLGGSGIVDKRLERSELSVPKMGKARVIANLLSKIPTIEYIGVSGSLSMNNSVTNDDIDLFFITKKNTLWISRFLVNVVLLLLKQKRSKNKKESKDKICPNMFMEDGKLSLPKKRINLYSAHEIVQLRTLYDRNNSQNLLFNANKWISSFLPNINTFKSKKAIKKSSKKLVIFQVFEKLFFFTQKLYMRKIAPSEVVSKHLAMFHPINKEKIILDLYELKSNKYLELFDNDQWIDSEEAKFYFDEKKIRILN